VRAQREPRTPGSDGTPIEEAPWWMLAITTGIFWLIAWPALVGLLAGWGYWHGERLWTALAALGIAALVVVGLATRPRWRRPTAKDPRDERPFFVRFSTWLMTAFLMPNILFGVIVLTHEGAALTYAQAAVIGAILSTVQGALALVDRWRRRRE
jgi:hypothetical protein